jgi:signal recognition particle subunit SRP54
MGIPLQTMFMTWIKTTKGKIKADRLGFYTRQSCEYVLMGSRGNVLKYKNPNRVVEVTRIPLSSILVTGIQGSGKTTTSGKLASYLTNQSYKVLLVSLDTARPAAQEQLEILAKSADILSLPIIPFETPLRIAKRALEFAKTKDIEVVIFDSAGRLHVDDTLMEELAAISDIIQPVEKLLVADSSLGFDAVNISKEFKEKIGVTGIILSRLDGDAKGGAAISMKSITGIPIKFVGVGEKLADLQKFIPSGMASRILGGADVEQLMDKAAQMTGGMSKEKVNTMFTKAKTGKFDFDDYLTQLDMMRKAGNLGELASMFPGVPNLGSALGQTEFVEKHSAIIKKMTSEDKAQPEKLKLSSGLRIKVAKQAGVPVLEINRMMQVFDRIKTSFQAMSSMGGDFGSKTPEQILRDPKMKQLLQVKRQSVKVKGGNLPEMFAKPK